VLLPVVTGLIGAGSGLVGTWVGVRQQRRSERQRILSDAAAELAQRLGSGETGVSTSLLIHENDRRTASEREDSIGKARWYASEAGPPLAKVGLLFPETVSGHAQQAFDLVRAAAEELPKDGARTKLDSAKDSRRRFENAARAAIWQSG